MTSPGITLQSTEPNQPRLPLLGIETAVKSPKMESAIGGILPKKRGSPRKEERPEEFIGQKRRRFAIKKVTQIKTKKDK